MSTVVRPDMFCAHEVWRELMFCPDKSIFNMLGRSTKLDSETVDIWLPVKLMLERFGNPTNVCGWSTAILLYETSTWSVTSDTVPHLRAAD